MTELRLDVAPRGVNDSVWLASVEPLVPQIGDLWLISWDAQALSLGLVTKTAPGFVLCWPVTLADAPVFAPAVKVEETPLDCTLLAWPTRETGLGFHMLHRRFGSMLSPRTIALISAEMDDEPEGASPLPFAAETVFDDEAERASDEMIDLWEQICLNVWPTITVGASPLSPSAVQATGIPISRIAAALEIPTSEAVGLVRGESEPSVQQVAVLSALFGADAEALLDAGGEADSYLFIDPEFKDSLVKLVESSGIPEAAIRDAVRSEYALAARSDGDAAARVRSIIDRLGQAT